MTFDTCFRLSSAILAFSCLVGFAPSLRGEETSAVPAWAKIDEKPACTFTWISDPHLSNERLELIAKAFHYIRDELKPDFVLCTGDNCYAAAPPTDPANPEPVGLRRQRFFQEFLQKHLQLPYVLLAGDDWPEDHEKVFGATQYSFDYAGLHFVFISPDRQCHSNGGEGLSVLDEPTWIWLRNDLDKSRQKPTLIAIHEPIFPPTFLDAERVRETVDRYPNVIGALQGHLHIDMETSFGGRPYLVAPSIGLSKPPAMKQVYVYRQLLVLRTIEYDADSDSFRPVNKWQKIAIPDSLQSSIVRPAPGGFKMANYSAVPPHPFIEDPTLANRSGELFLMVGRSTLRNLRPANVKVPGEE